VANTDFSTLARQQSEDSASAGGGGELGFVAENRLVPAVDSVVRSMTVGQVAGPIKTQQGVVFIKLLDRKAGTLPTLAQAHERLVAALRNRRASLLEQTYLTQYSAKLGVTVNQIELARLQQTLAR
jgi:peptidyl-prolyl cis-trans isomerase D